MTKATCTPSTARAELTTMGGVGAYATIVPCAPTPPSTPPRLAPSPRGSLLLRLQRHRARYIDLQAAAMRAGDTAAARAWDYALIRLDADIAGLEDAIRAKPIVGIANVIDRAIVAAGRGDAGAFLAELLALASIRGVAATGTV